MFSLVFHYDRTQNLRSLQRTLGGVLALQIHSLDIIWVLSCMPAWKWALNWEQQPCALISYSFSTLWCDRDHVGDKRSIFLQQDAGSCCATLCRWDVVIRVSWSDTANGSTLANRIVLQPPHGTVNVAMTTAQRPHILRRTLPVTKLRGHKSCDAPTNGSQDTKHVNHILSFFQFCRE